MKTANMKTLFIYFLRYIIFYFSDNNILYYHFQLYFLYKKDFAGYKVLSLSHTQAIW